MIHGIYTSGLAALGQSTRLGVISNNLANINTPGFRRDTLVFQERLAAAQEEPWEFRYYNRMVDRYGGAPFIQAIQPDGAPGRMDQTGRTLDVAISSDGPSFFAVQDPATRQVFYTRAGNFERDAQGFLTTADTRYQVLSADGGPIQLDEGVPTEGIAIDDNGSMQFNEVEQARLAVVRFLDGSVLRKHGDTLFEAPAGAVTEPDPSPGLRQRTLEMSSSNPIVEMVDLIETARAVESNLQMIRFQDAELERLINSAGRI